MLTMKNFLPSNPCGAWRPDFSRFSGPLRGCCSPFGDQWAESALYCRQSPAQQRRHPGQVVTSEGEDGLRRHLRQANKAGFAQTAHGLCPTKDFLDQLALLQTERVAGMPGRSAIDGLAGFFRRHVRRDLGLTHGLHEIRRVIALVSTQGAAGRHAALDHLGRRFPFCRAARLRRFDIDHQAATVLHQRMPHVAEPGLVAFALLEEPGFRVGGRGVGVVAALLALEIHSRVLAAAFRRLARTVLGHKALVGSPGVDQRAIDREMFIGSQLLPLGQNQDLAEELPHDGFRQQPLPVLRKGRRRPHAVIHGKADEPAVQEVVLDVLHQLPLGADGKEHLDKAGPQQPFGRDAGATGTGIQLLEGRVHRRQDAIDQHPQLPQGMIRRYPFFQRPVAEHRMLGRVRPSHRFRSRSGNARIIPSALQGRGF